MWRKALGLVIDCALGCCINVLELFRLHKINLDQPHHQKPVVLIVHGSGSNRLQTVVAKYCLRREFAVYSLNMEGDWSIPHYSLQVRAKITSIGEQRLHLIGISMGGLVACEVALRYPELVASISTICTPFKGAPILLTFKPDLLPYCPNRWVDLDPKSKFLERLSQRLHQLHCPLWTFGSKADLLIPNENTATHSYEHTSYNFPGHLGMAYTPSIFRTIAQRIQSRDRETGVSRG